MFGAYSWFYLQESLLVVSRILCGTGGSGSNPTWSHARFVLLLQLSFGSVVEVFTHPGERGTQIGRRAESYSLIHPLTWHLLWWPRPRNHLRQMLSGADSHLWGDPGPFAVPAAVSDIRLFLPHWSSQTYEAFNLLLQLQAFFEPGK